MPDQVELSVRSQLKSIIEELQSIASASNSVGEGLEKAGQDVAKGLNQQTKQTESFLTKLRSLSLRVADQIKSDFKALFSVEALQSSLKLTNQFKGTVKQSMALTDTIRKLGTTFKMSSKDFASFQSKMQKGLGDIGLSAEAGTNSLEGLVETPVRGEAALLAYSQTAGQLARVTGQKGQEGAIAKGLAGVVEAQGGHPEDIGQMKEVSAAVLRIRNATGKTATEALNSMTEMFQSMPADMRRKVKPGAMAEMSAAGLAAGPGSTKFLQEIMKMSSIGRLPFEAQGFKGVVGSQGINMEQLAKTLPSIMSRIGNDPEAALKTAGFSEEAAAGAVRFAQNLEKANQAIMEVRNSSADLAKQDRESMSLGEAFRANINKVLGSAGEIPAKAQNALTDFLSGTSQSTAGAGGVVLGGGLLASMLAGGGLRGIGSALFSEAGQKARETVTGEEIQKVYVVNAHEIGGGGLLGGHGGEAAGAAGGLMGKVSGIAKSGLALAGAAGVGYAIGDYAGSKINETESGHKFYDKLSDMLMPLVDMVQGNGSAPQVMGPPPPQRHIIEMNKRDLKESTQPTRGASF